MSSGILTKAAAFALVMTAAALVAPTTARGQLVTYATAGSFDGHTAFPGTSPATLKVGTGTSAITLTFTGFTDQVMALGGTTDSFGTFTTSGGTAATLDSLAGHTFNLYITQTQPTSPTGLTFSSTLQGTIEVQNSKAFVLFSTLPQMLGRVTYQIGSNDANQLGIPVLGRVNLNAPKVHTTLNPTGISNPATISGMITSVPEPASMAMCGTALLAVAGVTLRRRKAPVAQA